MSAAAVDASARLISQVECPNDGIGHRQFADWAQTVGQLVRVGIECSGSFGAALAVHLLEIGLDVREVPSALAHREAKRRHSAGKSDPGDALAIARVVLREESLPSPKRDETFQDLKLLTDYRQQLVRDRTQAANRVHKDLVVMRSGYGKQIPRLTQKCHLNRVMYMLRGDKSVRAELCRMRIADLRRLDRQIGEINRQIKTVLEESGTTLTTLTGISFITAAKIIGEIGDASRLRSKAGFAQLTGTAPLQASSGATTRHRLNRGGNRSLNCALHMIAVTRCRLHPESKAYVLKKCAEGKTRKEAMRCLKRQLSNLVYRELVGHISKPFLPT